MRQIVACRRCNSHLVFRFYVYYTSIKIGVGPMRYSLFFSFAVGAIILAATLVQAAPSVGVP